VENACELAGARAAMVARFFHPGLGEREREAEAEVKEDAASWCSRGPLGPDRWASDRRTDATAHPRGGRFLILVGHCRLNQRPFR
jgi:hypothetical protein